MSPGSYVSNTPEPGLPRAAAPRFPVLILGSAESESGFMDSPLESGPPRAWGSGRASHTAASALDPHAQLRRGRCPRGHQLPLLARGRARLSGADLKCGFEITMPRKRAGGVACPPHPCLPAAPLSGAGTPVPAAGHRPQPARASAGAAFTGGWRARSHGPPVLRRCLRVHFRAGGEQLFYTHPRTTSRVLVLIKSAGLFSTSTVIGESAMKGPPATMRERGCVGPDGWSTPPSARRRHVDICPSW